MAVSEIVPSGSLNENPAPPNGFNCRIKAAIGDTAYAGASYCRKQLSNWWPIRSPADIEIIPELGTLVARARDLDRNNGVAAGGFQSLNDNVVGTGLRLAPSPDYRAMGRTIEWAEEWSRTVESAWKTWAETTACDAAGVQNFHGMTQLVFRSSLENGEALALPLWLERTGTPFKTCVQLIDTDRLTNPGNQFWFSKYLRGGIEIDDYGKPLAYYIQQMPENLTFLSYTPFYGSSTYLWERIPAETPWGRKRVLHMYQKLRVDQTRGVPILAPVIEQFRMLDAYQRTELQSSIVNALVAGVIETPLDPAALAEMMGGDPNQYLAAKSEYRVQLEGGSMIPLYPGDKLTPFTPARPPGTFPAFVEAVLRQIGTAVGMPYELVLKDFSKTNYSSARAALLEAWRFFYSRRGWLAFQWAQPVYELWLEEAVNAGIIEAPDFYALRQFYARAKWIGPGRGWIDPVKEAEAAELRVQGYFSTLEMECAEQGLDWNEVLEQRALENARMMQLNLPMPPTLQPKATPVKEGPPESAPGAPPQ
jgi:lambda family phage portal protein